MEKYFAIYGLMVFIGLIIALVWFAARRRMERFLNERYERRRK